MQRFFRGARPSSRVKNAGHDLFENINFRIQPITLNAAVFIFFHLRNVLLGYVVI